MPNGMTALMLASILGHLECVRALLESGADVAQAMRDGTTALMHAGMQGQPECVRTLLAAGANVAQAMTTLIHSSIQGELECVRALLDAGADAMHSTVDGLSALSFVGGSFGVLQLLCSYAPSREAVSAQLALYLSALAPECAQWLEVTRRWTSPLHHFELISFERVRALLVGGADVRAGDGGDDAPTPLGLASARLLRRADGPDDGRSGGAALISRAVAPWSPGSHALFPAAAKARAIELLWLGALLARRLQGGAAADVQGAFCDAWLGHVMPFAVER
jgi:ankyrin repeat protein